MIHKYRQNGYNIVLDVGSGSVHVVDNAAYKMLDIIGNNKFTADFAAYDFSKVDEKKPVLEEAFSEIAKLFNESTLFSDDDYSKYSKQMLNSPIKAMCLNVAHDCNLRCKYCFASTGDYEETRSLMSGEIGKKAIDFLLENSANRKNIELDFFGGEPLMNFEVVKEVVEYARSKEKEYDKNFRFTITTNGMLLTDEIIDYINREMYNVVLSLDGRKEINDKLRVNVAGGGSYDRIVPKFQKLVSERSKDDQYYVRGTFTKHNIDFSNDVLHMYDLGFDQVSVEPVVGADTNSYALSEADIPEIKAEYDKLANKMIALEADGERFNFFHFMMDLSGGPCAIKRLRGCGAGNEYVAVTPEGDIYPCHQFVGHDEWKMGSLLNNTLDLDIKESFAKTNIYTKKECPDCWAKFYCSGGCIANSMKYSDDIKTPHKFSCELEKKRTETAIMMLVHREMVKA